MTERRNRVVTLCGCDKLCHDLAECDDDPHAVCKNLPYPPEPPDIVFYVVHRDDLKATP